MKTLLFLLLCTGLMAQVPYKSFRFPSKTVSVNTTHAIAPVFVAEAHLDNVGATTCTVTIAVNSGDTVVVFIGHRHVGGATSVSSVTDTGGSTYTKSGSSSVLAINNEYVAECWKTLSASASSSVTVTTALTALTNVSVIRYTGVNAFGNTGTFGATGVTTETATLTMQDNNNVILSGGLQANVALTATVGTLMANNFFSNQGTIFLQSMRNTSATTGSLSNTTTSASNNWAACAVELRSNP